MTEEPLTDAELQALGVVDDDDWGPDGEPTDLEELRRRARAIERRRVGEGGVLYQVTEEQLCQLRTWLDQDADSWAYGEGACTYASAIAAQRPVRDILYAIERTPLMTEDEDTQ